MQESPNVKIIVYVPWESADAVRQAMGDAGAGRIGNYTHCSFSVKGQGRFLPHAGAHPAIGTVGEHEVVDEERIEFVCAKDLLSTVITAMKKVHPYEEVAYDIYPLLSL